MPENVHPHSESAACRPGASPSRRAKAAPPDRFDAYLPDVKLPLATHSLTLGTKKRLYGRPVLSQACKQLFVALTPLLDCNRHLPRQYWIFHKESKGVLPLSQVTSIKQERFL